jgi:hypothetical protein
MTNQHDVDDSHSTYRRPMTSRAASRPLASKRPERWSPQRPGTSGSSTTFTCVGLQPSPPAADAVFSAIRKTLIDETAS